MQSCLDLIVGLIAGFSNSSGNNGGDIRKHLGRDLARHQDLPGCGQGFAGDTGAGIVFQAGVQHGVRDSVAQLVWVPLGDRLHGLDIFISHMAFLSWDDSALIAFFSKR